MNGYRVHCVKCSRRYIPTRRQVLRVLERKEPDFVCIHCWVAGRWRGVLYLLAALVLVGALLCSLPGCARGWGPGPSSGEPEEEPRTKIQVPTLLTPEQERELRRIDDASRKAVRDAEQRLRRLNPMGGG